MIDRLRWLHSAGMGMATASVAMLVLVVVAGPSIHAQGDPQGDPQSCGAPGHAERGKIGRGHVEHGNGYGLGHCGVTVADDATNGTSPEGDEGGASGENIAGTEPTDEQESDGDDAGLIDVASASGSSVSAVSDSTASGSVASGVAATEAGGGTDEGSRSTEDNAVAIAAGDVPIGVEPPAGEAGTMAATDERSTVVPIVVEPIVVSPVGVEAAVDGGIEPPPSIVTTPVAGEVLGEAAGPVAPMTPTPLAPAAMPNTGSGGLTDASSGASVGMTAMLVAGLIAASWVGLMVVGRMITGRVGRERVARRF